MSSHDIPCGSCGAVGAYDPGCAECRAPDPTFEQEHTLLPSEIAAFRKRMGLSQARLAARLPVPIDTLQNWEIGRSKPPLYLPRALRDLERDLERGQTPG